MTGFLALVGPTAPPRSAGPDVDAWAGGAARLWAERTGRPNGPRIATRGPLAVAADLRLDNRDDLRRALGVSRAGSDADLLLAAYERWGENAVERLDGPFSFALWDGRAGRLHAARDGTGLRPLYRARVGSAWAFGSSLPTVQSLVPFRVDRAAAADFLTGALDRTTRTLVETVERVLPATAVVVAPGGAGRSPAVGERRFWSPDAALRLPDDDAVVESAFRDAFDRAVLARLDGDTGALLSGGLDSSSIVATVRALRPALPLSTFSLVYDERTADERRYVDAVVEGGGLVPHRVQGEGVSMFDDLDRDLAAVGEPFPAPNLFLTRHLYERAGRAGLGAVLDGFAGDNVVAHGEQRMTELAYGLRLPSLLREGRAVARRSRSPRRMALHLVRDYVLAPLVAPLRPAPPAVHFGRGGVVTSRGERDLPYRTVRASHQAELSSPRIPRAVEVAYAAAAAAGVEPRFPFLDRRLVEVCFAVPSAQRLRDGLTRSFLRRSLADRLPEALVQRADKARLATNFVDAFFVREAAFVRGVLYDGAAAAADALDLPALRRAYERAERDPTLRLNLVLPLWRATVFARWTATAPGRLSPVPEETLLLAPPAPAGSF
ncbi:asparagine synthase-related protein [Rubrivirga sp. S365]|uniref:asparagine synthase (glutamine-hydrolyzing) n=1 Tax=Rubrivirga litoralis TaxID=3075598 RepID=A0ABU3BQ10_9BACT|nr:MULTISPECIES: asparagine synthase-related protein [unclassified Rubrivirga]MDT0631372.1 asparagine synthase-related protein [Rubrivirga sp. F394]MDT7855963.1 asparagine synthase-related protein [Rubrivirga sp. S365]